MTRVALIHAVTVAMAPIEAAFRTHWPSAQRMNILDDTLSTDRANSSDLTTAISDRIELLANYALRSGAEAVLFTCSAFGPAIERTAAKHAQPILKPNEAMFLSALAQGDRIGMVATFAPSVASLQGEFEETARLNQRTQAHLEVVCTPEAMAALQSGDVNRHNQLVADAASRLAHCDAIMLAQFSTSVAAEACRARFTRPVLTSPEAAVLHLRKRVRGA